MFNTLYRCPRTVARHENAPLAESRRNYLEHLAAQGAAIHTIRAAAGVVYRATIMMMKLDESGPVERRDVERAAKRMGSPLVPERQQPGARSNRQGVPAGYLQLATIRRSTPRVRSSARFEYIERSLYKVSCAAEASQDGEQLGRRRRGRRNGRHRCHWPSAQSGPN